jgi:magnesium-transporting ATPase (P-type)
MEVAVNYWAVVLAAIASMIVGMVWYSSAFFGPAWQKLAQIDKTKMKHDMPRASLIAFVASLITAYILAHMTFIAHTFFKNNFMQDAITTAFWLGLGIACTTIVIHNSFDQRPAKLTLISLGNRLITLLVMGAIIGWLAPEVITQVIVS